MRRSFAGICIALLVALVVPLQGLTAAQGDLCMGAGHHHSHDAADRDDHHGGQHGGKSSMYCPPCVACCAAAAISPSASILIPDDRSDAQVPSVPPLLSGVQPDTLDRPPLAF